MKVIVQLFVLLIDSIYHFLQRLYIRSLKYFQRKKMYNIFMAVVRPEKSRFVE